MIALLLAWPVVSVGVGLLIGAMIRHADARERAL